MNIRKISINQINFDDQSTQLRDHLCKTTLDNYKTVWEEASSEDGNPFDQEHPPVLFEAHGGHRISDGWHRAESARMAGRTWLIVDLKKGSKKDAIDFAIGSNATHGLPRSNADKRKAVNACIENFPNRSVSETAKACAVTKRFVNKIKTENSNPHPGSEPFTTRLGGEHQTSTTSQEINPPTAASANSALPDQLASQSGDEPSIFDDMGIKTADQLLEPLENAKEKQGAESGPADTDYMDSLDQRPPWIEKPTAPIHVPAPREPGQDDNQPDPLQTNKIQLSKLKKTLEAAVNEVDELDRLAPSKHHQPYVDILQDLIKNLKHWDIDV